MGFFNKSFKKNIETKSNPIGSLLYVTGAYRGNFARAENFIKLGYEKNPTIKECVDIIAGGAASVNFELKRLLPDGTYEDIDDHPVLRLINRPNPTQTKVKFFQTFFTNYLVTGNSFLIADQVSDNLPPTELWNIPVAGIQIMPSDTGVPISYKFTGVRGNKIFPVNPITGMSQIFHSKTISLIDSLYGISPLMAGRVWIDMANEGAEWNAGLVQNGCQASGVLKKTGTPLTDAQYSQITKRWEKDHQGSKNAGVPMILDNGLEWTELGKTPKDMDFNTSIDYSDKKICGIYGVPYVLLSPDASTFNNVENARRILWEDTITKYLDDFLDSFDDWLLAKYPDTEGMVLKACYDDVAAFQQQKKEQADRIDGMVEKGIITRNEAREALGYEKLPNPEADEIYIPANLVPLGQANDTINNAVDTTSQLYLNQNDTTSKSNSKAKASGKRIKKT